MEKVTLCDSINHRSYEFLLSPTDARRVSTDIGYASALLRAATMEEVRVEETPDKELVEEPEEPENEPEKENVLYRWTPVVVMMLLRTYQELQKKFEAGKVSHKKCWESVANKLNAAGHPAVTGPQCSSKLRSLKKTYKAIKDHNSKSGNDRRTWQYFEVMQEIFAKAAWCEPVAVASSSGVVTKRSDADSAVESASPSSTKVTAMSLLKRRLDQKDQHELNKKKRHEERLAMDKQLLAALQSFSSKK